MMAGTRRPAGSLGSAARLAALGGLACAGAGLWAYRDYRAWRALGLGGLPPNVSGWVQTTRWRLMKRDPFAIDDLPGADGDAGWLANVPRREGGRPKIAPHPVPHRQLTQLAGPSMRRKLTGLFDSTVQDAADVLVCARSHFEKRNQAITLRCPTCGHADALASNGEIAHVHESDGSMHMIMSRPDANAAIRAGWAERHGLAGVTLGLPGAYMMVYAPRDDRELSVVGRLLDASIAHMSTRRR